MIWRTATARGSRQPVRDNAAALADAGQDLSTKRLVLLKEAVPGVTRVAILANPTSPSTGRRSRRDVA
jgi:hypothetical protein